MFLGIIWFVSAEDFSWYRQSFAEDQVGWRCANIRLYRSTDSEECAGEAPKPLLGFVVGQGIECLFETSMEPLDKTIRLRVVGRREMSSDAPSVEKLLPDG